MISRIVDQALMAYHIGRYHAWLGLRDQFSRCIEPFIKTKEREWPGLTIFISSFNTLWPLKLTLASMEANSNYQPRQLIIGENSSKDGSGEFLQQLSGTGSGVTVHTQVPQPHGLWLDFALQTTQTRYLACVDSDLLFFRGNLLQRAIDYMEQTPDCWLLEADRRPAAAHWERPGVHCPEALATWLFVVRTELREKISSTFLGQDGKELGDDGRPVVHYECGAMVLEEMRSKGLRYDVMPWWMRQMFYHFGSLSWVGGLEDQSNRFTRMKQYQKQDIERRARKFESKTSP